QIKQGVRILPARQAHHHLVAFFNHVEVGNGLAGFTQQALLQLVLVDALFLGAAGRHFRGVGGKRGVGGRVVHGAYRERCTSMPTAAQSEKASGLLTRMRARRTSGKSWKMRSTRRSL